MCAFVFVRSSSFLAWMGDLISRRWTLLWAWCSMLSLSTARGLFACSRQTRRCLFHLQNALRTKWYVTPIRRRFLLTTLQVGEYITSLVTRARELSNATYLTAAAASFRESWRMVDAIMQAAAQRKDSKVTRTMAEDVV